MSKNDSISMSVIRRLPRYYRFLSELNDQNIDKISSTKLAQIMNVTASQVRQDLNCFGGFGQQGYGYSVSQLKEEIKNILGLNNDYKAILIGAGNLGKAVAMHMNFEKLGFELIACGAPRLRRGVQNAPGSEQKGKDGSVHSSFMCGRGWRAVSQIWRLKVNRNRTKNAIQGTTPR